MCLAIPARVTSISGTKAKVEIGGNVRDADLSLLDDVQVGDYVMLHAGFAISKYEEEEARETLDLWSELTGEQL